MEAVNDEFVGLSLIFCEPRGRPVTPAEERVHCFVCGLEILQQESVYIGNLALHAGDCARDHFRATAVGRDSLCDKAILACAIVCVVNGLWSSYDSMPTSEM